MKVFSVNKTKSYFTRIAVLRRLYTLCVAAAWRLRGGCVDAWRLRGAIAVSSYYIYTISLQSSSTIWRYCHKRNGHDTQLETTWRYIDITTVSLYCHFVLLCRWLLSYFVYHSITIIYPNDEILYRIIALSLYRVDDIATALLSHHIYEGFGEVGVKGAWLHIITPGNKSGTTHCIFPYKIAFHINCMLIFLGNHLFLFCNCHSLFDLLFLLVCIIWYWSSSCVHLAKLTFLFQCFNMCQCYLRHVETRAHHHT